MSGRVMRIAVVEDEAILAMELEALIEELGHAVVAAAASSAELEVVERAAPDLALVDIHLADGPTGVEVGRQLAARGTAVVFMTANLKRIPPDYAGALGAIGKPYTQAGFGAALAHVAALVDGVPPPAAMPASLLMSPSGTTRAAEIRSCDEKETQR